MLNVAPMAEDLSVKGGDIAYQRGGEKVYH